MKTDITTEMIRDLRHATGVGIGKCKEALEACKGSVDEAIEWLRKSGMAQAVKKEGRTVEEGQIGFEENADKIALVELRAETDFVVKNDQFKSFLSTLAKQAAETGVDTLESFKEQKYSGDAEMSVDEFRANLVQTIGENIQVHRVKVIDKKQNHSYGLYSHLGGKIVTLVEIEGGEKESALAKEIAMHVAAAAPDYLSPDHVPADVVEKEKEIFKSQMKGKPENIMDKIIAGKLQSYMSEICLIKQNFIKDDSKTIEQLVEERGKEAGTPLTVSNFIRWSVGK